MKRFHTTIAACILMILLLPLADRLAVSHTSPTYTHFVYMAGHANLLHWAINAWTLLVLHNLFRWYRVTVAYAFAVLVSYILLPPMPMLGASVFTCFFIGFAMPHLWTKSRLTVGMTVALLLLTCILPNLAGVQHVAAFTVGILFSYSEGFCRNMSNYLKQ